LFLVLTLLLAAGIAFLVFGSSFLVGNFDEAMQAQYLVYSRWHILLPSWLLLAFLLFFVRVLQQQFSRQVSNWFLLLTGLL
jgi:hypothetical protein